MSTSMKRAAIALALGSILTLSISAQLGASNFGIWAEGGISGGGTGMDGRPLLPRSAIAGGFGLEWRQPSWVVLSLGLRYFKIEPSWPDASLFLYRGFAGQALVAETGPLLKFAPAGLLSHGSELELLAGFGLAATGDTGTTLVSMEPLFRLDPRLVVPFHGGWHAFVASPVEYHLRGAARTMVAGAMLGLGWSTGGSE